MPACDAWKTSKHLVFTSYKVSAIPPRFSFANRACPIIGTRFATLG
jgi:hypothetical protein